MYVCESPTLLQPPHLFLFLLYPPSLSLTHIPISLCLFLLLSHLALQVRLVLNSGQSSCLWLPSAEITGIHHHTWFSIPFSLTLSHKTKVLNNYYYWLFRTGPHVAQTKHKLSTWPKTTLVFCSSCLCLAGVRIAGMHSHPWLAEFNFNDGL